jgi:hypothetical protein
LLERKVFNYKEISTYQDGRMLQLQAVEKIKFTYALRALQIDSILWQRMSNSSLAQAQESLQ